MRDQILMQLVDKAISDPEFRANARKNVEGVLRAYGYDLTPDELGAVKAFQAETAGLSDGDLDSVLAGNSQRRQFAL
jgi:hypothetical protein